ncbi:MAG: hypothetical protein O7C73_03625 [Nitrospirae bacterium]|nr:hypothetical protein [Nitrospirota bacterium]MEC4670154.1 hypothetical protein [Nitrospirota bacterium]
MPEDHSKPQVLMLGTGERVSLKGEENIWITIIMGFRVQEASGELGRWKVKTTSYYYYIGNGSGELVGYHWHAETTPHIWFPHIHVRGKFKDVHLPTGRISIEEVLRLAINDFKVKATSDWEKVLLDNQRRFEKYRAWD